MLDLRAIVRARMIHINGGRQQGAMAHLASLVAPRWSVLPLDALSRLSRWLGGHGDIKGKQLEAVLDVLGLTVAPAVDLDVASG